MEFRNYSKDEINQVLGETGVKTLLAQNAKMKRSSQNGIHLYNFGIPAFKSTTGQITCPNAKNCVSGCYARSGAYLWSNVSQAYESRLALTKTKGFEQVMVYTIDRLIKKHKTGLILIRVHDSGDFYSEAYQSTWYDIAKTYHNEPRVQFYAYTKMISQSESLSSVKPNNFRVIYSYGGFEDFKINIDTSYHSRVFESIEALNAAGYIDGTHDDTIAALGTEKRIGLVYHGVKSFNKTNWSK